MFVSRKDGFTKKEVEELDRNIKNIKNNRKTSFLKSRNGSNWGFFEIVHE